MLTPLPTDPRLFGRLRIDPLERYGRRLADVRGTVLERLDQGGDGGLGPRAEAAQRLDGRAARRGDALRPEGLDQALGGPRAKGGVRVLEISNQCGDGGRVP